MPLFYFHVRDGEKLAKDLDGSVLPDLDTARVEALAAARDILATRIRAGEVLGDQKIEITDGSGTVLTTVLLREAICFG